MIRAIRFGALGMAAVLAAVLGYFQFFGGAVPVMPKADIGGHFRLASSKGGVLDSDSLKGQPHAIFFGFTHCPEVCPTTLYEMSAALETLGDEAKDFRVLFVTVDPERDTLAAMADYIANFDPRMEALVPTADELQQLARDFRVYFKKVPTSDGSYTMDHTATVYLMDGEGQLASTLAFGEEQDARLAKLRKLLGS